MTEQRNKKILTIVMAALMLVCGGNTIAYAATVGSYNGNVTKYTDFETSLMTKEDKSEHATNIVKTLPAGTYESWTETSNGINQTYKTQYNRSGTYYMLYKQMEDSDSNGVIYLYTNKAKVKLNISTVLTNYNSGGVSGRWSPDTYK